METLAKEPKRRRLRRVEMMGKLIGGRTTSGRSHSMSNHLRITTLVGGNNEFCRFWRNHWMARVIRRQRIPHCTFLGGHYRSTRSRLWKAAVRSLTYLYFWSREWYLFINCHKMFKYVILLSVSVLWWLPYLTWAALHSVVPHFWILPSL